ncbi:MAG: OPT family oligopeptide transporter [Streptosporangiales bacterium]|nr:OPT family oligopeptide transporter [Streptosporangiales bacterium]
MSEEQTVAAKTEKRHPRALAPGNLVLIVILSVFGAIIGMQILVDLGIAANTSLIGALVAMVLARVPMSLFANYRSVHSQNLIQSGISSATFGAANSLLLPIGIPWALGRPDLVLPMFCGVALAMLVDAVMVYRLFDTKIFPAAGTWPPGVAAAEAIQAGDKGGKRAGLLGIGVVVGGVGSALGIPMSAFGVAFIANIVAMVMFGIGLLIRQYSTELFSGDFFAAIIPKGDIDAAFVPHGFMIGAGLVALVQVCVTLARKNNTVGGTTRSDSDMRRTLGVGSVAYLLIAVFLALVCGLWADMSPGMLVGFVIYAGFAALVHELIVGLAAMHAGWFPAFAVALITLVVGMIIGFPLEGLVVLVAFSAATGPAFADMGYDLRAGFILRGRGADPEFELAGRRQQLISAMIAFAVAITVVLLMWESYFSRDLIPPVDRVFAATIKGGVSPDVAMSLAMWAIPGAIVQLGGGSKRQAGILFATGLLVDVAMAGWAVLAGIAIRFAWQRLRSDRARSEMEVVAGGIIAGDALFSFGSSTFKSFRG